MKLFTTITFLLVAATPIQKVSNQKGVIESIESVGKAIANGVEIASVITRAIDELKADKIKHTITMVEGKAGESKFPPTIVFGGMGSLCTEGAYPNMIKQISEKMGGTHVECFPTTMVESVNSQAQKACDFMKKNEHYNSQDQINVVGVSQGGLIGRFVVEECEISAKTKVRNLMTVGSPNMGFTEIPEGGCQSLNIDAGNVMCKMEKSLLKSTLFSDIMQNSLSFPGYYRPTDNKGEYTEKSSFLAALNNEKKTDKFDQHKDKIKALNAFMLVQFDKDQIIFPQESETFGEVVKEGDKEKIVPMKETDIYRSDLLGLKTLDEQQKLKIVHIDNTHTDFSEKDLQETFIPFLKS